MENTNTETANIKEIVKEKYGQAALRAGSGGSSCCGAAPASGSACDPITSNLYDATEMEQVPEKAMQASLGCGNPTALAKLSPGETVLDLGSGGGIDVLLSARRVGPTGKAYGLDMTDEMLALANENKRKAGAENVEFLRGEIEHIPLPDNSVDVIISNCVINLSADKDAVLQEAFRVLKPGGRFAVSDVVTRGEISPAIRQSVLLWVGCVAGALDEEEYRSKLAAAGFEGIEVEPTRIYRVEDAREFLSEKGLDVDALAPEVDGKFYERIRSGGQADGGDCENDRKLAAGRRAASDWPELGESNLVEEVPAMQGRYNVLFLCTGNSARSIMAEAILNYKGRPTFTAYSAGSHATGKVRPEALKQLELARLPTSGLRSKNWDEFAKADAPKMNFVFTVCDNAAKEVCPVWPGQPMTAHWGVADPAEVQGTPEQIERAFREAYMTLDRRISLFLCLPLASLDKLAIQKEIDRIGKR